MNKTQLISLIAMFLLALTGNVTQAQTTHSVRDFLFIGIDPKTLNGGRNADIYLIRSDGSRVANLTNTPLDSENYAFWSADGTEIYFSRNSMAVYSGSTETQSSTSFYVMEISEKGEKINERLLFNVSDVVGQPMRIEDWALSPDEQTLVFIPYDGSLGGTFVVNIDGTNLHQILPYDAVESVVSFRWSPDSTEFAYITQECARTRLTNLCPYWVVQRTTNQEPQQIGKESELMKRWYPDDIFLAYDYPDFVIQRGDIVIMRGSQYSSTLAPDGNTLAYAVTVNDAIGSHLETMSLGKNTARQTVTSNIKGIISFVHWSPDSKQIAFVTRFSNNYEAVVYVVNADGSGQQELLRREIWFADTLAWRPDPLLKD